MTTSRSQCIFDSTIAGFPHPVTWMSNIIDLSKLRTSSLSFEIFWADVAVTWCLWRYNDEALAALAPPLAGTAFANLEFTAAYRLLDPLWVDPVIADPAQCHIVAMLNVGTRYMSIGYSAANWAGVAHQLTVVMNLNDDI